MADDLDTRRRRASYRANHRGTKEMDVLVGRYADARIDGIEDPALDLFERLLAMPDPTLQAWIFSGEGFDGTEFADLIPEIRAFHGLSGSGA